MRSIPSRFRASTGGLGMEPVWIRVCVCGKVERRRLRRQREPQFAGKGASSGVVTGKEEKLRGKGLAGSPLEGSVASFHMHILNTPGVQLQACGSLGLRPASEEGFWKDFSARDCRTKAWSWEEASYQQDLPFLDSVPGTHKHWAVGEEGDWRRSTFLLAPGAQSSSPS